MSSSYPYNSVAIADEELWTLKTPDVISLKSYLFLKIVQFRVSNH